MKTNIIVGILLLISQFSLAQWPVNGGAPGTVIGTIGEPRGPISQIKGRIHNGTDCIGSTTNVYSINGDQIERINTGFNSNGSLIKNNSTNSIEMTSGIIYRHINILSSIASNKTEVNAINSGQRVIALSQGQLFATMVAGGTLPVHVHVENGVDQNYLSFNGYGATGFSFLDNVLPQFGSGSNSEGVSIYKNLNAGDPRSKFTAVVEDEGLSAEERPTIVYGPIDVVANAYQQGINESGNSIGRNHLAPHSLGFHLVRFQNSSQIVFEDFNRLNFDYGFGGPNSTPASRATRKIIHASNSIETNPYFIVTNQFVNGVATDSSIKTELLQDGDYEVLVRAEGTRGTSGGPLITEKIKKLRLDNYKAYIKKVSVVDQNNLEKYNAEWSELTRPGDGSVILTVRNNEPFKSGTTVTISVTTSEKVPSLTLGFPIGSDINMTPVGTDGVEWQASFTMPTSDTRTVPLRFTAGDHLYGFVLNQNAADVKRDPTTGKFSDQTSVDKSHQLRVCPSDNPLTLGVSVGTDGQQVTLSGSGGTEPYEYSVDELPIPPNHVSTFSSTSTYALEFDKDYIFKVRDAGGCQAEKYYTLPKVACNALTQSGGQGTQFFQVNLGTIAGTVYISYDMYTIPDQMIVTYHGTTVINTGSVSGSNIVSFEHTPTAGESNVATIEMYAPLAGTLWVFTVNCPSASKPAIANSASSNDYKIEYANGKATIVSTAKNNCTIFDLLYKQVGEKDWNTIRGITLPYQLTTTGEMQIKLKASSQQNLSKTNLTVKVNSRVGLQTLIEPTSPETSLSVSPNPSVGPLVINYVSAKSGKASLVIYNSEGKIVYTKQISAVKGLNTFKWIPGSTIKGLVLIKVLQEGKSLSTKALVDL